MMDNTTRTAFERLLKIAQSDTGQSGRVASFVLAWWNAADHGGFDIADLFAVDAEIGRDMATVFFHLVDRPTAEYPEAYRVDIEAIIRRWRPEVWERYAESA
ncbi:hypothetical protein FHS67_005211 [Aminobacter aminovorans]|uniref:DUF7673 domain-containing protein n=2 Tax=Aminobacter aminovorans TaxID=83263 RepID=A0AAC9ATJ7_AMIAI|nr:hypothetical protein AA2016_6497 [Aminobacter aminovorans]MBB3708869.1 hypothetical protein [Aminobacter aminovorans]